MRSAAARQFVYDDTVMRKSKPMGVAKKKTVASVSGNKTKKYNKVNTQIGKPVAVKPAKIELSREQIKRKEYAFQNDCKKLKICFLAMCVLMLIIIPNVILSGIGKMNYNEIADINTKAAALISDTEEKANKLIIVNSISNVQAKAIAIGMEEISNKEVLKPIQ